MITLLTATGARPVAWALCEMWMAAQDYAGPVRWVIVDDGLTPQPITFQRPGWELVLIRPSPFWEPGMNTQARNIQKGLGACDPRFPVIFIEDDDHYAPDWLSHVTKHLEGHELVGEVRARYYNFHTKTARQLANTMHSSLCSTAIQGIRALKALQAYCQPGVKFIDLNLWRNFRGKKQLFAGTRVTGIKGLPGREGIGMGHQPDFVGTPDRNQDILRSWIGANAVRIYNEHIVS